MGAQLRGSLASVLGVVIARQACTRQAFGDSQRNRSWGNAATNDWMHHEVPDAALQIPDDLQVHKPDTPNASIPSPLAPCSVQCQCIPAAVTRSRRPLPLFQMSLSHAVLPLCMLNQSHMLLKSPTNPVHLRPLQYLGCRDGKAYLDVEVEGEDEGKDGHALQVKGACHRPADACTMRQLWCCHCRGCLLPLKCAAVTRGCLHVGTSAMLRLLCAGRSSGIYRSLLTSCSCVSSGPCKHLDCGSIVPRQAIAWPCPHWCWVLILRP